MPARREPVVTVVARMLTVVICADAMCAVVGVGVRRWVIVMRRRGIVRPARAVTVAARVTGGRFVAGGGAGAEIVGSAAGEVVACGAAREVVRGAAGEVVAGLAA
ncbi:hypothetical protein, partial [Streptomyces avermitilis]|uniref:hypothetical protein n=1 Tax=Streptomyces avermitilis TaxID=33903 RepID=UPI0033B4E386